MNLHPIGNPNIANEIKTSAKTPIGKFRRDIVKFSREYIEQRSPELLELFDWCRALDTKQIDYLLELKNIYSVLQQSELPAIYQKLIHSEPLSKRDIETFRLLKDILVESHKLKYGDKKVIERIVTYEDVRNAIFSDHKIIEAEVIQNVGIRQSSIDSGCGEDKLRQDGIDKRDNKCPDEIQESEEHSKN